MFNDGFCMVRWNPYWITLLRSIATQMIFTPQNKRFGRSTSYLYKYKLQPQLGWHAKEIFTNQQLIYDWASLWNCLLASASMVQALARSWPLHSASRSAIALVNLYRCVLHLLLSHGRCLAYVLSAYSTAYTVLEVGLFHAFEVYLVLRDSIPWQRSCMQRHTLHKYIFLYIYIYV